MMGKKRSKNNLRKKVFGFFFAIVAILGLTSNVLLPQSVVYADPENSSSQTTENNTQAPENTNNSGQNNGNNGENNGNSGSNNYASTTNTNTEATTGDGCKSALGAIGWLVCPTTGAIAGAVDFLYGLIQDILAINPVEMKDGTPIYEIWKYCRGFANIVFIIFLLVVIYSQITGLGISNYGIKKALPKLIVVAVLINLSFLICSLAVDASNIIGNSLRGLFTSVETSTMAGMDTGGAVNAGVANAEMFSALAGGSALAIGGAVIAFETGAIWMMIPVMLGAIVAVVTGLITIALRQAVVVLLVMIAPLAIVAYMLPNTENLFTKWRKLLIQMLVVYPAVSLLFGASSLAGFAIIMSATDGFGLLLGVAVQIFPLFFAWKLMQMSGTVLGTINTKMRELGSRPVAGSRTWAESRRAQTNAKYMKYGMTPFSHLRRYMDNRRELREQHTASMQQMRKNDANIYVQKMIGAGYDGTKAQGTDGDLVANKYTKVAKDLSNSKMAVETATLDTAHVLGNYSDYFVDRNVRTRAARLKKDKDEQGLLELRRSNAEYGRAMTGANNFLELSRAQMTAENDSEADFNYMVEEYLGTMKGYDPNDRSNQFSKYKHYIASSAGGLGDVGQTRVLGKIIAKAAAVESNQRRDINIIANKYPHAKRDFRNMYVGYYVDDNGYATDKDGNVLPGEKYRGYLLQHHPEQLVLWDKIDDQGRKYFDWYDGNQFVTRVYETDKSALKELLSNFDTPINDPINNLYGILAGVKPGENGVPEHVGLNGFRTTIGRSLSSFKEKNAAFSPMVSEMIKKGYIQNYAQEYLAYLDSLNKATKPGAFNVQDADAIGMFATILNPDNWDEVFPTDLVKEYKNVNGEPLTVTRVDGNGNKIKIPATEATREELMERLKSKFIFPAAHKITMMMSKQTPNTADNQKAGTVEKWKELVEVLNTKWGKDSPLGEDPYEQVGDMRAISRGVRQNLHTISDNVSVDDQIIESVTNYYNEVEELYINSQNDTDGFATSLMEYCIANAERTGFNNVLTAFRDYYNEEQMAGRYPTCDDLRDEFNDLITQFCTE